MPFEFEKLNMEGAVIITPKVFKDNRGFFMENYKKSDFLNAGIDTEFVQENISSSAQNVLRGLHYQTAPYAQAKLVKCIKGKIHDVLVDLRPSSKTFKQWAKIELSEENNKILFIPEGFAHGFVVLSKTAQLSYKTNKEYAPQCERGMLWCDKEINVDWGIETPILSEKDKAQPTFNDINKEELA